jgi:16S rRNA (guanine966-N2)-methyltransferase
VTRIITGSAGGRTLRVPPTGTRPTSDRVREALFSRIDALTDILGASVLDLYAGSGAVGFEAASRGASQVDLVDNSDKAIRVITDNFTSLAAALPNTTVKSHRSTALSFLDASTGTWDIVFLDPPYDTPNSEVEQVLTALVDRLSPGALVAVERSAREPEPRWPAGIERLNPKTYGETTLYWLSAE